MQLTLLRVTHLCCWLQGHRQQSSGSRQLPDIHHQEPPRLLRSSIALMEQRGVRPSTDAQRFAELVDANVQAHQGSGLLSQSGILGSHSGFDG